MKLNYSNSIANEQDNSKLLLVMYIILVQGKSIVFSFEKMHIEVSSILYWNDINEKGLATFAASCVKHLRL